MENMLKGRIAWVTGASGGMGGAAALTFAREGAAVIVSCGGNSVKALETVREIEAAGGEAYFFGALDVADEKAVREYAQAVISRFGRIDVLACFAGRTFDNDGLEHGEHYRRTMDVNMTGTYACCTAVFEQMKRQRSGSIIICSSNGAFNPTTPALEYHMAKGACEALASNLAFDGARFGVRVNCIKPGCILTPFWDELIPDKERQKAFTDEIAKKEIPLGRVGTAQDIANAALFFASDLSSYITGLRMFVGGGQGYIYSAEQSFLLSNSAQEILPAGVR